MGYTWEGKSGEVVHIVYERGDDIFVSTLVGRVVSLRTQPQPNNRL